MHTSFFQLGRLHIPVFGVFAALGVMAALALSQRTARYAGLSADAVWNAGMTAVVSLFVISRLLLVAFNWHSFVEYPLQLLAVPSLSSLGVVLTWIFMLGYLRVRGIPLLAFLDAMAPCAALAWVFLSAGRFADGTRDGMPMGNRARPVELYTLFAALAICLVLFEWLRRNANAGTPAGTTAGTGLVLAGAATYFIAFFRLPSDLLTNAWIDPAQAVALLAIVVGMALALRGTSNSAGVVTAKEVRTEDHHAV